MKKYILLIELAGSSTPMPTGTSNLPKAIEKARTMFNALHQLDQNKELQIKVCHPDRLDNAETVLGKRKIDESMKFLRDLSAGVSGTALGVKVSCALMSLMGKPDKDVNIKLLLKNAETLEEQILKLNKKLKEKFE